MSPSLWKTAANTYTRGHRFFFFFFCEFGQSSLTECSLKSTCGGCQSPIYIGERTLQQTMCSAGSVLFSRWVVRTPGQTSPILPSAPLKNNRVLSSINHGCAQRNGLAFAGLAHMCFQREGGISQKETFGTTQHKNTRELLVQVAKSLTSSSMTLLCRTQVQELFIKLVKCT